MFLGNKSWKDLTQGLSHISDQSVWLQGSVIRNGQEVLKKHEQIEKAEVYQNYTTTALKNRSYGVMNTNLRFFINMRGGGRERDTTCLSYGLTENTCFSLPYPAQSPAFFNRRFCLQKCTKKCLYYMLFVIRLLIPFTPLSGLLIFIPLTRVALCTMLVTAWLCL